MSVKTIETRAVISAQDKTGSTFSQVAQKLRGVEQAAARASRAAAGSTRTIGDLSRVAGGNAGRAGVTSTIVTGAAIYAAHKTAEKAREIIHAVNETYRDFDDKVRYQRAILGIDAKRQKPLIDQAIHMGASTRFNDLQVIEAQLGLAQRGVKLDFIEPITQFAADFGQAMDVDLPTAAKTLESALFSTAQNMEEAADAMKNAQRTTDLMVKTAKIGGLGAEDVMQLFKFGGAAGHAAGLSIETMGAMGAMMSRGGIRGDEAGVAIRSIAGALVSPTEKAQIALNAMGIDFNKFVKVPNFISPERLEVATKREAGIHFSDVGRARLRELMQNSDVIGREEDFVDKSMEAISEFQSFDGATGRKLAKVLKAFWKASIKNVDSEGLLRAIIEKSPTASQSNAIFTKQQGGRFNTVAQRGLAEYLDFRSQLQHAPQGFAAGIGKERMGGYAGAQARLEGAVKNLETALGRANDVWVTPLTNAAANLTQKFVESSDSSLRMATAIGAATTAVVAFEGALKAGAILDHAAGKTPKAGGGRLGLLGRLGPAVGMLPFAYPLAEMVGDMPSADQVEPQGAWEELGDYLDDKLGISSHYTRKRLRQAGIRPLGQGGLQTFGLGGPNAAAVGPLTVSGVEAFGAHPVELKGAAEITNRIIVEPSPDFILRVEQSIAAKGHLRSDVGVTMPPSW